MADYLAVVAQLDDIREGRSESPSGSEWNALVERAAALDDEYVAASDLPRIEARMQLSIQEHRQRAGDGDTLFAIDGAPIFFSQLTRGVEGLKQPKAPAGQWKAMIGKLPGVKKEEIEWSGVNEWLDEQKGSVAKEDLVGFLEENQVTIEEVTKGSRGYSTELYVAYDREEQVWDVLDDDDSIVEGGFSTESMAQDVMRDLTANRGTTKFKEYTLPGGENYRELLLTLPGRRAQLGQYEKRLEEVRRAHSAPPWQGYAAFATARERDELNALAEGIDRAQDFRGGHFDEPNVLAHVRFNERTDADGKRVLFIEEIQSDWHQKGRQQGYRGSATVDRLRAVEVQPGEWRVQDGRGDEADEGVWFATRDEAEAAVSHYMERFSSGVPDAPFKTSWHELAFKRMLRYAAENDFERIAWTTGEQQAERYDLSKRIAKVQYIPATKEFFAFETSVGPATITRRDVEPKDLPDIVGKEVADRLLADESKIIGRDAAGTPYHELKGQDLRIGGDGMKGFYDKMLPRFANKYAKKWGARVGDTKVDPGAWEILDEDGNVVGTARTYGEMRNARETGFDTRSSKTAGGISVHALDVTPAMRESVLAGQSLFALDPATGKRPADELRALDPIPVSHVAERRFAGIGNLEETRRAARTYALETLKGDVENRDTGWSISIQNQGLSKATERGATRTDYFEVLQSLHSLLENAVLVETQPDRRQRPDIKAVHVFYAPVQVVDSPYLVKLTVREHADGRRFYDHGVSEIITPSVDTQGREPGARWDTRRPEGAEVNIGSILTGVNHQDGTPVLPDDTLDAAPSGAVAGSDVVQATEKQIRRLIQRIAPQLTGLKIVDGEMRVGDRPFGGRYTTTSDLIEVSLSATDPVRFARHEGIHHLRNMDFFTPDEWKALADMARKAWLDDYNIEGRYGEDYRRRFGDQAEERLIEEAIADAYSVWQAGTLKPQNAVRRIFEKVKRFFAGIGRILRNQGYTTYEQVFGRIESGAVGARPIATDLQSAFETKDPDQIRAALARARMDVNPPTKEQLLKGLRAAGLRRLARLYQQTPESAQGPLREAVGEPMDDLYALDGTLDSGARETAPAGRPSRVLGTPEQEAAIRDTMQTHDPVSLKERARSLVEEVKNLDWVAMKQRTIDQFASWEAYEKAVRGKVGDAAMSPYKMARLTQNLQSTMTAVLHHGPLEFVEGGFRVRQGFEGGFQGIFEPLAEDGLLHLWKGWAAATRAKRLMDEGRESNFSREQIDALLPLDREYPQFQEAMDQWQAFNKAMLDMAESAGLLNAEQRAIWEKDDYVPFYRVMEEGVTGPRNRTGLAGQRSGIKTLTGSEEKVGDLVENMVLNLTHLVDASFKNVATQRLLDMLDEGGMAEGEVVIQEGLDWKAAHVSPADAANKLREIGVDVDKVPADQRDTWLKLFTMVPPKDPDVISVMRGGQPEYYRVNDPLLLSSLATLRPEGNDMLMEALRLPKRALTVGVTTMPGFMMRNFIRDTLHSWVVTGEDFTPFIGSAKGFMKSMREDPSLVSIMAHGGGSGGFYRNEAKDVRKQLDRRLKGINKQTLIDTPLKALEWWRRVGQASENANRIAVHDAIKKKGGSDAEAAYQAMNLLDFSMRGDARAVRFLIETIPFLNARLQGLHRLYQGAKENPKTFMLRGGVIMGASLALVAANWGDERYDDLEEWEKDTYYHIFLDNLFPIEALRAAGIAADEWHLRLPKPFEIGAIFSTVPERILRAATGKDEVSVAGKRMLAMFHDTFAVGMPQFMQPMVEQVANKNFFTDRPIVSMRLQRLVPEAQYTSRTSGVARLLGELTGTSPIRIDELVRGYGGTLGMYLMQATGGVINAARGDRPVKPEWRADRIPEIGGFIRNHPMTTTKYVTEFYEMRREVQQLYATYREYRRQGRTEDAKTLVEKHAPKLRRHRTLEKAGRQMADINRRVRAIEDHPTMGAKEKRRQLSELQIRRNALTKRIVTMLKQATK